MHSRQDEPFDRSRPGLMPEAGRTFFHYVGDVIPMPAQPLESHSRVAQRVVRAAEFPDPAIRCRGTRAYKNRPFARHGMSAKCIPFHPASSPHAHHTTYR